LNEQLDAAVEALMAHPDAPLPRVHPRLAALLRVAADLRHLPRSDFKARLKADLAPPSRRSQKKGRPPGERKPSLETNSRTGGPSTALRTGVSKGARRRKTTRSAAGFHTATPCLIVRDASRAIDFYKRAFGATELMRLADPSTGKLWHAEVRIGNSPIALADEDPDYNLSPQSLGGSPVIVQIYVEDVDAIADQAVAAGAQVVFPVADQFYGDRAGRLADPFGHIWIVATHKEDVPIDEMRRRAEAFAQPAAPSTAPAEPPAPAKPIPEGIRTLRPYLQVESAARMIDFLQRAFGAQELFRAAQPDGRIDHAEVTIEDSTIEMGDATAEYAANPTAIHLYVQDADAVYTRALRAGATSMHEPVNQDYGDREASIKDPFGNHWYIATPLQKSQGAVGHVPEGLRNVMPYLHPRGAPQLIEFLRQAFGAQEVFRAQSEGIVHHAKIRIGDAIIEMGEAHGPYQPMAPAMHLLVDDTDAVYARALQAGAASVQPPTDRPWGQRSAGVTDKFGNLWWIAAPLQAGPQASPAPREAVADTTARRRGTMPFLYIRDAGAAAEFYERVLGATELMREVDPSGIVSHVQIQAGDAQIMIRDPAVGLPAAYIAQGLSRTARELGSTPVHLYLYVDDVDTAFHRALAAGAQVVDPLGDKEWGDRCGGFQDPFGHIWYIATPLQDAKEDSTMAAKPVPQGYHSVTPYLKVEEAPKLIDFLKRAFEATEVMRAGDPSGHFHAEVRIGDSMIMMGNAGRSYPAEAPMPAAAYLYVEDVDAVYKDALEAGATTLTAPQDMEWGDRMAGVRDPFGNVWYLATHKKDAPH
jgi:PhnB protein